MHADPTEAPSGPTQREGFGEDEGFGEWGHDPHVHLEEHLFVFAPVGHAVICAEDRAFHLTESTGVWVPAGVWHSARFDPDSLVEPIFFPSATFSSPSAQCQGVAITVRCRRLLLGHLRSAGHQDSPGQDLYSALFNDSIPLPLPLPTSLPARRVAAALLDDPADQRGAVAWAASAYTSPTSLRRAFLSETGYTFSAWRTRARVNASIQPLTQGRLVGAVAGQVGFASTNGFILAFRRHLGMTPMAFVRGSLSCDGTDAGRERAAG